MYRIARVSDLEFALINLANSRSYPVTLKNCKIVETTFAIRATVDSAEQVSFAAASEGLVQKSFKLESCIYNLLKSLGRNTETEDFDLAKLVIIPQEYYEMLDLK